MKVNADSSLEFIIYKLHAAEDLEESLDWMQDHGSSVLISWGEDTKCWECSWITGGDRFTGVRKGVRFAIMEALNKAAARFNERRVREGEGL